MRRVSNTDIALATILRVFGLNQHIKSRGGSTTAAIKSIGGTALPTFMLSLPCADPHTRSCGCLPSSQVFLRRLYCSPRFFYLFLLSPATITIQWLTAPPFTKFVSIQELCCLATFTPTPPCQTPTQSHPDSITLGLRGSSARTTLPRSRIRFSFCHSGGIMSASGHFLRVSSGFHLSTTLR